MQAALYQCKDAVLPAQNDAASVVRKAAAHPWGRSTNIMKPRVGKPKFYVLQAGLHFTHLPSSLPAHQRQLSTCTCGTKITRALFLLRGREELSSPQLRPASGYYLSSPLAALLWAALLQHHHPSLVLVYCSCAGHHTLGRPSGRYLLLAIKRPGAVSLTAAYKSKMRKGEILPYPE